MTYYVCKQCNYKHTFLPFECVKCKGTNFYPLVTSEPTGNTSISNGMEIQEDVLKLRIENERLKEANNHYKALVPVLEDNAEQLRNELKQAKEVIKEIVSWANWEGANCPSFKDIQNKAEQFLKEAEDQPEGDWVVRDKEPL